MAALSTVNSTPVAAIHSMPRTVGLSAGLANAALRCSARPWDARSNIERAFVDREGRVLHRLGQRRMGVADHADVLGGGAELHRHDRFGDQLGGHGADDMHAENLICFFI